MKNYVNGFGKWNRLNEHGTSRRRDSETELVLTLGTDFAEYADWFARYAEICPNCVVINVLSTRNDMEITVAGPQDEIDALIREQKSNMGMDPNAGDIDFRPRRR